MMTDIHGFKGDLYQAVTIAKYELIKHIRSKKLYIFLILLGIIFGLTLAVFITLGFPEDIYDPTGTIVLQSGAASFMLVPAMLATFVVIVAAIFFAATALVSEFEERTALLMFTRPVRKSTIVLGKFIASALITTLMVILFFGIFGIISLANYGEISGNLLSAIGVATAGAMCYIGMAFLFSSFAKKASTASILTLIANLIIISMISALLSVAAPDLTLWFMPDYAMDAINTALGISTLGGSSTMEMGVANVGTSIGVLLAWCVGTMAASYAIFRKRDF